MAPRCVQEANTSSRSSLIPGESSMIGTSRYNLRLDPLAVAPMAIFPL
jgi:hypothetical protein